MKLCRYRDTNGVPAYGVYRDDKLASCNDWLPTPLSDDHFWSRLPEVLERFAACPQDRLVWQPRPQRLLPPIPTPEKIICIGLNYLDHAIETGATPPTEPVVFSKFATALIGDGDEIELPRLSQQVDYEAELVVVIGKTGKQIAQADAMSYVAGYTCGHDVSARDWQKGRPGGQWLLGKSFDTFAPVGPCLVTADEIREPGNVAVSMQLNGQQVQHSRTSQLIFDIPTLVAHLSNIFTLSPGDLIFTGTPPGVGVARNPPLFLKDTDLCQVTVEGIGTLSNRCRQMS